MKKARVDFTINVGITHCLALAARNHDYGPDLKPAKVKDVSSLVRSVAQQSVDQLLLELEKEYTQKVAAWVKAQRP